MVSFQHNKYNLYVPCRNLKGNTRKLITLFIWSCWLTTVRLNLLHLRKADVAILMIGWLDCLVTVLKIESFNKVPISISHIDIWMKFRHFTSQYPVLRRSASNFASAANFRFPPFEQKYCIAVIGNMSSNWSFTPEKMNAALVKIN